MQLRCSSYYWPGVCFKFQIPGYKSYVVQSFQQMQEAEHLNIPSFGENIELLAFVGWLFAFYHNDNFPFNGFGFEMVGKFGDRASCIFFVQFG